MTRSVPPKCTHRGEAPALRHVKVGRNMGTFPARVDQAGESSVRMPGFGELIIILVIVLLVFGANKLPMLGEGVGKAIKNFKRGLNTDEDIDVTPSDKRVESTSSAQPLDADKVQEAEVVERKS